MAAGGSGTTGQGLTGGASSANSPPYPTGGGGGWKSPGESPTGPTISGSGGAGDWVSMTGSKVYYGGGGGGGTAGGTPGKGGIGGGGNGGILSGQNGTPGTGGGGGGTNLGLSGSGGSGIVIIRYDAKYPDLKVSGNPVYQNIGEAKVYQFLTSGIANWESKTVTINDSSLPIPTYTIVPNVTNVNEGASATFTVTTTYVRNNTTLYWKNTGTRLGSNFDDGTSSGSVTIINNTGTIVRPVKANNAIDSFGAGTIIISLYTDNAYNNLLTSSTTVTVNDTSWPDPVVTWPTRIIFDRSFDYSITGDKIGGTFTITNPNGYSVGPTSYPGNNTGNYSGSLTIATGAITAGTYDFTFTFSSGKTIVKSASVEVLTYIPVEYLVVAGGGGGASFGGGGGAGGVRSGSGYNIVRKNTLNVNVGGSGTGGSPWTNGQNGGNSEINGTDMTTITSIGGGGAGSYYSNTQAGSGGSGGGGGAEWDGPSSVAGLGTAGQGYNGGAGGGSGTWVAGGGGGAGGAGGNAYGVPYNGYAGDGGPGYKWIDGNYYGGGGGGACHADLHNGSGGSGIGGAGGGYYNGGRWVFSIYGGNGAISTGSGGGGGGYSTWEGWQKGGNGGSGVVIIRYPSTYPEAVVTSNATSTNVNGYRTYTFTNSGTFKIL